MHRCDCLRAAYLAIAICLSLAAWGQTTYPVVLDYGTGVYARSQLSATKTGSTTAALQLSGVKVPTINDFVAGTDLTLTTSTGSVSYAASGAAHTSLTLSHVQNTDIGTNSNSWTVNSACTPSKSVPYITMYAYDTTTDLTSKSAGIELDYNDSAMTFVFDGEIPPLVTTTGEFGGSGASLTTLSASSLASGNIAYPRMPTGTGTWTTGGVVTIADTVSAHTNILEVVASGGSWRGGIGVDGAGGSHFTFLKAGVNQWAFYTGGTNLDYYSYNGTPGNVLSLEGGTNKGGAITSRLGVGTTTPPSSGAALQVTGSMTASVSAAIASYLAVGSSTVPTSGDALQVTGNARASQTIRAGDNTNYVNVDSTDSLRMYGTATTWEDLRVDGNMTRVGESAPTFGVFLGGTYLQWFSKTTDNSVHFSVQMPHAWAEGTDIDPHVHWVPNSDGAPAAHVVWTLEYTWQNALTGDVFHATSETSGTLTNPSSEVSGAGQHAHYITDLGDISGTGKTISSVLVCRLYRDADNAADDYDDTAGLLYFDIHYQVDALGSKDEYTK
jgi:hypothetical protein